jgi:hypothetical protein
MAQYLDFDDVKKHLRVDFDDDDAYIIDLIDMVEALVLNEVQGLITGEGVVETALTPTTGTVQTAGTTALIGTTTNFLSFTVGETITVSGETVRTIATITDDTHLTVTSAFSTTASGLSYVVSTKKLLIGTESNFAEYNVGDLVKVDGETFRTIDSITDDTHLTVTVSFANALTNLAYQFRPGIPSPIRLELKQGMLLMIKHYYDNRDTVLIGVGVQKMPYGFEFLVNRYKNWTVA